VSEIDNSEDYTVSVWIYPKKSSSPEQYMIYQNCHSATARHGMNIEEDDRIKFGYYDGSYHTKSSDTITDLGGFGKWYHVVGTKSGSTVRLWVNGVEQTGASSFYAYAHTTYMFVGKTSNNDDYFEGAMDEFAVYDRALSEAEVQELYFGQKNKHQLIVGNWIERGKHIDVSSDGDVNILDGNLDVQGAITADSYSDHTKYWSGTSQQALNEILQITAENGKLNHESIPEFTKTYIPQYKTITIENCHMEEKKEVCEQVEKRVIDGYTIGRDIGATVTLLIETVKELNQKIEELETRITKLEKMQT